MNSFYPCDNGQIEYMRPRNLWPFCPFFFFLKSVHIWCSSRSSRFDLLCSLPFYGELWKLSRVINKFSDVLMLQTYCFSFHMFFPGTGTEVIHTLSSPLSFGNPLWRPLICVSSCQRSQLLKAWTSPWQCVERKDSPMTQQIYRYRYLYLVMIDICTVSQN